jgi:hypothetical protein
MPGYSSARQFQAAIQALEQSEARFLVINQLGIARGDWMMSYVRLRYERVLELPPYELYVRRRSPP